MKLSANIFLVLTLVATFFSTPSTAETFSVSVAAGRTTNLRGYSLFNDVTCHFGPKAKVSFQQPKNGTLSVAWGVVGLASKGVCKKQNVKGYIVKYTPKPGFRGKDVGKVSFSYLKYETSGIATDTIKFNLTVK